MAKRVVDADDGSVNEDALDLYTNRMLGEQEEDDDDTEVTQDDDNEVDDVEDADLDDSDAEDDDEADEDEDGEGEEEDDDGGPSGEPPASTAPQITPASQADAATQLRQLTTTTIPLLQRENTQYRTQVQSLQAEIGQYRTYSEEFKKYSVTPEEALAGLRMAVGYRTNPAGFIAHILAHAKTNGVKLEGLPVGGIDAAAIGAMITQQLQPIVSRYQAQEQSAEVDRNSKQQAETFFSLHPDARQHESFLVGVIQRFNMDPEAAYWKLRADALEAGFDWSQPLAPQLEAAKSNNQRRTPKLGNTRKSSPNPAPRGGRNVVKNEEQFPMDMSYRQIARRTAKDLGYDVTV